MFNRRKNIFSSCVSSQRTNRSAVSGSFFIFRKKKKFLKISFSFLALIALIFGMYFNSNRAQGANFTWNQTNWSGGATANIADHTDNQTGWTEFSQKDTDINATASEITLDQQAISKLFSTDTDFNSGANSSTSITGTGDAAAVELMGQTGQISAGVFYTCARKTDGSVFCWGDNGAGQLGDNTTTDRDTPVQVKGVGGTGFLSDVSQVSSGDANTCALKTDGSVFCWGTNTNGQLGDNSTTQSLTPVQVLGVGGAGTLSGVSQIAAGDGHTCARKTDDSVFCWGDNTYGQLGDNSTTQRLTPVQVLGVGGSGFLSGISQISAGGYHTCVLKTDNSVFCWGDNTYGQLGDNSTTQRLTPVQVLGVGGSGFLSGISQVTAGGRVGWGTIHTCAVKTDGSAFCWGNNTYGQLGDNSTTQRLAPVQVLGVGGSGTLSDVSQIDTTGELFTCALKTDGSVFCWGFMISGTPVQVLGVGGSGFLSGVSQIAAGEFFHVCALKTDGSVFCWGGSSAPVQVLGTDGAIDTFSDVSQIAAGYAHTCTLKTDNSVSCWGNNGNGQLGDNSTSVRYNPVQVKGVGGTGTLSDISQTAAGNYHTCALKTDGSVFCWGYNQYGQLGDNTQTQRRTPIQVLGVGGSGTLSGVSQITAGQYHTCALKTDGSVFCWGSNSNGQLGDNTTADKLTPIQVLGVGGSGTLSGVSQIAAGQYHTCAVKTDGSVFCWGSNSNGQLGDNTQTQRRTPIQVLGVGGSGTLSGVSQIAAGYSHTCALKTDGSVFCWGYNQYGQLGDNTQTQRRTPIQVLGVGGSGTLSGVSQIAAGQYHACAVKTDGSVFCWGYNQYGQLGDNTTAQKLTPIQVLGVGGSGTLSGVSQITTGESHTCALKTDGSVFCWGDNTYGKLGDNTTAQKLTPIQTVAWIPPVTNLNLGFIYSTSGTYTSASTDLGSIKDFATLSFNKTTPADTTLTVDVRVGNTSIPDGTWTAWQLDISDEEDISALEGNQYVQYRANLATTDNTVTPILEDLSFNFTASQSLISSAYNTEIVDINLSKIQWTEDLPTGANIQFQLRTSSDGTTWGPWCGPDNSTPGTCNSATFFTDPAGNEIIDDTQKDQTADQYFQYKAVLSSAGTNPPSLSSVTVSYATIVASAVTTDTVSDITTNSATGNGTVDSTGGENPERFIEWGTVQSGPYPNSCSAGTGGTGTYSCNLTSLTPDTTYYVRAKATNSIDIGYGTERSFQTLSETAAAGAPTLASITDIKKDSVKLNVAIDLDEANESLDFIVEITNQDEETVETANQTQTTDAQGNVTLTINDLDSDTDYAFRVKYSPAGLDDFSPYSNSLQAKTDQDITGNECAPTDLKAKTISTSQIDLTWKDNCEVEDGYYIESKKEGGSFKKIDSVGENKESYHNKGLDADTTYEYRVRAYRDKKESEYSKKAQATTEKEPEQLKTEIPTPITQKPIAPEIPVEPTPAPTESSQPNTTESIPIEPTPILSNTNAGAIKTVAEKTIGEKIKNSSPVKSIQQTLIGIKRVIEKSPIVEKAPTAAQVVGVATGAASAAAAAANPLNASSGFFRNFGVLGRARKKKENWGTVFDFQTRRPIAGATVSILNSEGRVVDSIITDAEGRYGFLAKEGSYTFEITKNNYELVSANKFDEFYGELYDGSPINVSPGGIVTQNIALKAINIDWKEEARRKIKAQNSILAVIKKDIPIILFYSGLIATIANFYFNSPSIFNSVLLFIYGILFIARVFFTPKSFGTVVNELEKPIPFTIISFYDPQEPARRLAFTISDILGRYYLIIKNGSYLMKVQGQELEGRSFNRMFKINVKDGVAKEDVVV